MKRSLLLLFVFAVSPACRESLDVVLPDRLGDGGGGMLVNDLPTLDIVVKMTRDSTGFNAFDLMQLIVNGENRVFDENMTIGGNWAVYTIPGPGTDMFDITLNRRRGNFIDDFEWGTVPYTGPTIDSVAPDTAMVGTQVTINGFGFSGGALRVFFGGVEGTVDASTDSTITATVPADALPGLVWVLIDADAAHGVVGFQPLDTAGEDVPVPTDKLICQLFPARGKRERVIRVWGYNFTGSDRALFNGEAKSRILNVNLVDVPPIGEILMAFAVPNNDTPGGSTDFTLENGGVESNDLPFLVEENE
ncbi:MAG: IPT/TIG domain-containing protein [Planctomycetota bacterium]|jgi:hypothetical protein